MLSMRNRLMTSPCAALLLVGLFATLSGCAGIPAKYQSSQKLALRKGFLGPYKYTYENGTPAKVYGMVSYSASFKKVLSQQPAALAEAERAVPYHYATLALAAGLGLYSIVTFVDVISQSDQDPFGAAAKLNSVAGVMLAGSVFGAVLGYPSRSHLLRAVDHFNGNPTPPDLGSSEPRFEWNLASVLPSTVQLDPVGQRVGIGWVLRR